MCGSMADIQSPTAEMRRGKKRKKKKNKRQDENILWPALLHRATIKKVQMTGWKCNGLPIPQGDHKETTGQKYNVRICYAGQP